MRTEGHIALDQHRSGAVAAILDLTAGDQARTVLLRHVLPDGTSHFDWMIEAPIPIDHRLATWRLASPPFDAPAGSTLPAEHIGDHRAAYLTYEGALGNGRGEICAVARGMVQFMFRSECGWGLRLAFHGRNRLDVLLREAGGVMWRLDFAGVSRHSLGD